MEEGLSLTVGDSVALSDVESDKELESVADKESDVVGESVLLRLALSVGDNDSD